MPSSHPAVPNAPSSAFAVPSTLSHLPPEVGAAFAGFRATGNAMEIERMLNAVLVEFARRRPSRPLREMPPETRLIEDLGFDSLSLAEVLFLFEDVFEMTIANEEIAGLRTLADLRLFLRRKVGGLRR